MGDVPLTTASHGSKSTTLEGLKMSKLVGVDTGQVENETFLFPESRPEQVGTQLGPECANCGDCLGGNDGPTYCRECGLWAYLDDWQP
jgi:hypothetical protein